MKKLLSVFVLVAMLLTMVVISTSAAAWDGTTVSEYLLGDGTADSPYRIETAEDLAFLAKDVDGGNSYEGMYIIQTADIDLGNKEWEPIGKNGKPFSGVYDGKGFKITNMYISKEADGLGLFGQILSGYNYPAGVANVNLSGAIVLEEVTSDHIIGGLAGYIYKNTTTQITHYMKITNTVVDVDITIKKTTKQPRVGGFAGYGYCVDFENCVNNGDISTLETGNTPRIGGFVGQTNRSTYTNCVNNGAVTATGANTTMAAAGFLGMLTDHKDFPENKVVLTNCINNGEIKADSTPADLAKAVKVYAGGFVANSWKYGNGLNAEIINCYNKGKVTANNGSTNADSLCFAGGIASHTAYPALKIDGSVNSAEVTATGAAGTVKSAGIMGAVTVTGDTTVVITNCTSVGPAVAVPESATVSGNTENVTASEALVLGKTIEDAVKPSALKINNFPTEPGSAIPPRPETTRPVETTETPTTETPTTAAPTTDSPTTEAPAKEEGCGSIIAGGLAVIAIISLGGIMLKKKD